ncbi:MAG: DUF4136 domain-containing protein [Cyclobacteriaceae bacterium]|nr:DUF4136 domain-containing protein [Cyclobacteriaceae bacterium]
MRFFIYAAIAFFLSSCTTKVISFYVVDESRISFDTFSFYARDIKKLRPQQKLLDSLIERSISNELINKGYNKSYESDIYVSYKITMGTSSTTNIDNQHFNRYNQMYYPNYNVTTTNYKEGVLLIEFWDKHDKLLWQGSKSFKVRKSVNTRDLLIKYAQQIAFSFKPML